MPTPIALDTPRAQEALLRMVVNDMCRQYNANMTLQDHKAGEAFTIVTISSAEPHAYGMKREWTTGVTADEVMDAFRMAVGDVDDAKKNLQQTIEDTMRANWHEHFIMMSCAPAHMRSSTSYNGPLPGMSIKGQHEDHYASFKQKTYRPG